MFIQSMIRFFHRDIDKLIYEINSYENEADMWEIRGTIKNSAGKLVCHLLGNLNHYIGQGIGDTGYQRNRPLEFSIEFVPTSELVDELEQAKKMIEKCLPMLLESDLNNPRPLDFTVTSVETMMDYIIHLHSHLNWHLGQINYHRRMRA